MLIPLTYIINTLRATSSLKVYGLPAAESQVTDILFDSRSFIEADGTVFCALRTKAGDGHRYVSDMYDKGIRIFLTDNLPEDSAELTDALFLVVPDVAEAIEALASDWRKGLRNVVGITGSAGKTIVKEHIYYALARYFGDEKVTRSPRSWNSRLGVPLSILEASPADEAVIIEVGIDTVGDMARHAEILRPDIGVLTAITSEHDSGFASIAEKIAEKLKLFSHCRDIFYDARLPEVVRLMAEEYPERNLHPAASADSEQVWEELAKGVVGEIEGPDAAEYIEPGIATNRIDVHQGPNDCVVFFDDFTNDLRSLRWSLDFMRRRSAGRNRTLILTNDIMANRVGQEDVKENYEKLSRLIEAFGISRLIAIGRGISKMRHALPPTVDVDILKSDKEFTSTYDITNFSSETILVFGSPGEDFNEIRRALESPRHDSIMEINLDAIIHNFNYYKSLLRPSTGLIAMVKASAYGIGAPEVAKTLQGHGARYLAVAVIEEGIELRRRGVMMPIMVLNPVTNNYSALFHYSLEPSVFSLREFDILSAEAAKAGYSNYPIHVKLDTGMHRVGFVEEEIPGLLAKIKDCTTLKIASVFSHLATADCPEEGDYTRMQLETFDAVSSQIIEALPYRILRHILNTAGIMTHPEYQYDMVRLGIGLYGISPIPQEQKALRPVATLKTTIISLKQWPAGTSVGYGRRGRLERPSVVATLPIGYADGIDRHLRCGAASFLIRGVECPTVGNICMDQCMVDVTDVPGVEIGDSVEIFGEAIPVERIAGALDTIPYEVLTSISPRVRRIYYL